MRGRYARFRTSKISLDWSRLLVFDQGSGDRGGCRDGGDVDRSPPHQVRQQADQQVGAAGRRAASSAERGPRRPRHAESVPVRERRPATARRARGSPPDPGAEQKSRLRVGFRDPLQPGSAMWPIALACLYLAVIVLALWRAVRAALQRREHGAAVRGRRRSRKSPSVDDAVDVDRLLSRKRRRSGDGRGPLRSALPR